MDGELAFKVFKLSASGLCCTQIMLKLALDDEGSENEDLIRAVHGLCRGIGDAQKTCGVLIGGIGVIGLYAGKGSEREYAGENLSHMIEEYCEWFESEFESTECERLIGVTRFEDGDQSYQVKCGEMLVESYAKVCEILSGYDYEYGSRDER